jgi:ABC-type uncharacterized transport system permease subunit
MPATLALGALLGFFVKIDAEKSPWGAIFAAIAIGVLLWFVVAQATRREERRAGTRRDRRGRHDRNW